MAPCTIRWCGNTSQNMNFKNNGITFHRYPRDPPIKTIWINATRRQNWFPAKHSVICSRHFTQDCFMSLNNAQRRRLLQSAVPTLYLPLLSQPEQELPKPSTSTNDPLKLPSKRMRSQDPPENGKTLSESLSTYTTPAEKQLCRRVNELTERLKEKNKGLKKMGEKIRYMRRRLVSLKKIIIKLRNQEAIHSCKSDVLVKVEEDEIVPKIEVVETEPKIEIESKIEEVEIEPKIEIVEFEPPECM